MPYLAKLDHEDMWHVFQLSMSKIYTELFISSFNVYREMPADVNATKGVLNLPNYVARIIKDN